MKVLIDNSVCRNGAEPFLGVWRFQVNACDPQAIRARLADACAKLTEQSGIAVERYRDELRKLGRDPNRYRISSDALLRRVRKDGAVRSILPLVDANNVISIRTGWPAGCYDLERVSDNLTLRLGHDGELLDTLGKGALDITALPVLCDDAGPFGSTVSDSTRARIRPETAAVLLAVFGYGAPDQAALDDLARDVFGAAGGKAVGSATFAAAGGQS